MKRQRDRPAHNSASDRSIPSKESPRDNGHGDGLTEARNGPSSALLLAASPETSIRNGARAVELARAANRISGSEDLAVLRALAAALAEAGRFSEASEKFSVWPRLRPTPRWLMPCGRNSGFTKPASRSATRLKRRVQPIEVMTRLPEMSLNHQLPTCI
jgi:hypothetical protein